MTRSSVQFIHFCNYTDSFCFVCSVCIFWQPSRRKSESTTYQRADRAYCLFLMQLFVAPLTLFLFDSPLILTVALVLFLSVGLGVTVCQWLSFLDTRCPLVSLVSVHGLLSACPQRTCRSWKMEAQWMHRREGGLPDPSSERAQNRSPDWKDLNTMIEREGMIGRLIEVGWG